MARPPAGGGRPRRRCCSSVRLAKILPTRLALGALVRQAMATLPRQQRAVLVLRYCEDLPEAGPVLARATARAAAAVAVPARKGPRAGQPVHPREISFTAARRAVITSTRAGAATASLPAALTEANRDGTLAGLARRRVQIDRNRHRDRKTKARPGFPPGGPRLATQTAPAQITVCAPIAA